MSEEPHNTDLPVDQEKFKKTEAQLENIANEIKQQQPLASNLCPVEQLRKGYETGSNFEKGVLLLTKKYQSIRTIRGDGNCYYRAFLYSLCEKLWDADTDEKVRIKTFVEKSSEKVVKEGGYDETATEIFYDCLVNLVTSIVDGTTTKEKVHEELLQENSTSDYCTWYLRVLTGTQLKSDPSRFLPYLEENYVDIASFCKSHVEPMSKDVTMVQVLALAEIFGVQVKIEYLDGHEITNDALTQHQFGPEDAKTCLTFLYRPGHYDILYPKEN